MSWYPLHDLARLGPTGKHRTYATALLSTAFLLASVFLFADQRAEVILQATVRIRSSVPVLEDGAGRLTRQSEQYLHSVQAFDAALTRAGLSESLFGPAEFEQLPERLTIRVAPAGGQRAFDIQLKLASRHPRAAQRLLDQLAIDLVRTLEQSSRDSSRSSDQLALHAVETQRWQQLRGALDDYQEAVTRLLDDYFVDEPSMLDGTTTVSTRGSAVSMPLNPQWLTVSNELEELEVKLADMLRIYSEQHPLVIQMRDTIRFVSTRLDGIPMFADPADSESAVQPAQPVATRMDLGELEDASVNLRQAVDNYLALRSDESLAVSAPADQLVGQVLARTHIAGRRGGWAGGRLLCVLLSSVAVSYATVYGFWGRRNDVLRSADELRSVWQADVLGCVGNDAASSLHAVRDPLLPGLHVAELLAVVLLSVLIGLLLADGAFFANVLHDPRLALREVLALRMLP